MSLPALDGVLLIDKPSGCTSHDVVDRLRRKLKMRRIGHAGTLDPLATGLLILLVGKATKASQYLMGLEKEYEATMLLGVETNSHDSDGEVVLESPVPSLTEESLKLAMQHFEGDQFQTPPCSQQKKSKASPSTNMLARAKQSTEKHA